MQNNIKTIEITVNNHAGVMSHITGLFSRRGYNLEGIACAPTEDKSKSVMFLYVGGDVRLPIVSAQLKALYDVQDVHIHEDGDGEFSRIYDFVNSAHRAEKTR